MNTPSHHEFDKIPMLSLIHIHRLLTRQPKWRSCVSPFTFQVIDQPETVKIQEPP